MRSTSACGGSSATKRWASSLEMNLRGRGMMRQDVDHLQPVLLAAARGNLVAQHDLLAGIVHEAGEHEFGLRVGLPDGPAGEAARHRDHVLLGVAAVHAERVQFHHLAAVVLVEPVRLARQLLGQVPARWRTVRPANTSRARSIASCPGNTASPDAAPWPAADP